MLLFTFSSVVDPEMRAFLQEQNLPFLAKPYEVADLISQVRSLLAKQEKATPDAGKSISASAGA